VEVYDMNCKKETNLAKAIREIIKNKEKNDKFIKNNSGKLIFPYFVSEKKKPNYG
jgi:hypothetical protein